MVLLVLCSSKQYGHLKLHEVVGINVIVNFVEQNLSKQLSNLLRM